jgi:hypothetical protein
MILLDHVYSNIYHIISARDEYLRYRKRNLTNEIVFPDI